MVSLIQRVKMMASGKYCRISITQYFEVLQRRNVSFRVIMNPQLNEIYINPSAVTVNGFFQSWPFLTIPSTRIKKAKAAKKNGNENSLPIKWNEPI